MRVGERSHTKPSLDLWLLLANCHISGISGHLLISAHPVTSHSHLISQLLSPVLSAAPHHQSTRYIASQTLAARLFFVISCKTLQHFPLDWFPAASPACLRPIRLVWSPENSPAFCPWLLGFSASSSDIVLPVAAERKLSAFTSSSSVCLCLTL